MATAPPIESPAPTPTPAPAAAPPPDAAWLAGLARQVAESFGYKPEEPPSPPVSEAERAPLLAAIRDLWPHLQDHKLNPGGTEFSGIEYRGTDCNQLNIIQPVVVRRRVAESGWSSRPGGAPVKHDLPPLLKGGR